MTEAVQDPVHMDPDGQFYFHDETWKNRYGPYPDYATAQANLQSYIAWYLAPEQVAARAAKEAAEAGQPAPAAQPPTVNIQQAMVEFFALRDQKSELAEQQKKAMQGLNEQLEAAENFFLDQMNVQGVKSFKTDVGLVSTTTRATPKVEDPAVFRAYVRETGQYDLMTQAIDRTNFKAWREAHPGEMPPGVTESIERTISVRKG